MIYFRVPFIYSQPFIGQVGGVGIASAIFQSVLDRELRKRIDEPDAAQVGLRFAKKKKFIDSSHAENTRDSAFIAFGRNTSPTSSTGGP